MKVIYKKTLMEKFHDAQLEASKLGKTIEKIVLNREEGVEFDKIAITSPWSGRSNIKMLGIPVEFE